LVFEILLSFISSPLRFCGLVIFDREIRVKYRVEYDCSLDFGRVISHDYNSVKPQGGREMPAISLRLG
jgi:hypothetical protein